MLSSRVQPRLPVPRLRAQGQLLEIGTSELALGVQEANALLQTAGVEIADSDVDELIDRTEGWAAGLYLAAIAASVGSPAPGTAFALSGDNRIVGDYLRDEVLDRLSPDDAVVPEQASILGVVSGPLCDAALDTSGSAARLEAFENRNLLVVPLDERREWYRFHRLFGELLRSELHRHEPELEAQVHGRGRRRGIRRTDGPRRRSNTPERRTTKICSRPSPSDLIQPMWASGRVETVRRWLEWLADDGVVDRYPELAVHGALLYALLGHPAHAETWANAAQRSEVSGTGADGSSIESILAYLRAFLCRDGIAAMRGDSLLAYEGLGPTSPYRRACCSLRDSPTSSRATRARRACADPLGGCGDGDRVDPLGRHGLRPVGSDRSKARRLESGDRTQRACTGLIADGTFDEYWSSAPVFAFGAWIAIQSGRIDTARTLLVRAERLRPLMTYARCPSCP